MENIVLIAFCLQQGRWASTVTAVQGRATWARQWLKLRPEKEIVLISHGCFLHYLTDDWVNAANPQGAAPICLNVFYNCLTLRNTATSWYNTEFRSFVFAEDSDDDDAYLIETQESRLRRGQTEDPLSKEQQSMLKETVQKTWVQWGVLSHYD